MAGKLIIPRCTVRKVTVVIIGILLISFFVYMLANVLVLFDLFGDWDYIINKKYCISNTDPKRIAMMKIIDENCYTGVFNGHITKFSYNERFVCFKGVDRRLYEYEDADNAPTEYYIFDMSTETVYGPYSDGSEYFEKHSQLGVGETCEWISTDERPEGAFGYSIREIRRLKKYLNE